MQEIPFPDKKYQIIYADPPWSYYCGGKKNASRHYKCQPIQWIWDLPVKNITDANCILFLWSTFPVLPQCIETIKRWGFRYATNGFVWVKRNRVSNSWFWGCGNYTRANAEICLIGVKGSIKRKSKSVHSVLDDSIMEHSRKPDCARNRIVKLCGDLPRIELFARQRVEGWDAWGNQVDAASLPPQLPTETDSKEGWLKL
jgi:N6-adenosine-specific RNA methylase IME4